MKLKIVAQTMRKFILYILAVVIFFPLQSGAAETEIQKIRKLDRGRSTQIYVTFNKIPQFSHTQRGKRLDVILDTNLSNTEPLDFPIDDKVVKFLTQDKEGKTILTFFFRYEPQKVETSPSQDNSLVIDILLGNEFTKEYPELTSRFEGLSVIRQKDADYTNPHVASPYAGNWRSFFSRYEPEIQTSAPLKYTIPPFPIIDLIPDVHSSNMLPAEFFSLSSQGKWKEMIPLLLELVESTEDFITKKHLALVFGEILFRADDYANAYRQLYLLKESYQDEYLGIAAAYLLAALRGEHEDPYIAYYQYGELEDSISNRFPLSPFILLAQIETALATGKFERAYTLLQKDDIAYPPRLKAMRELRQADYWFATGSYVKAYVGYQFFEENNALEEQPYSLNGYCYTLYSQKKYREATQCYHTLSSIIPGKSHLSRISLKKALAELHYKSAREMYVTFSTLEDTYSGTEVGYRAAVKKTDIRYLSQPSWRTTSATYYRRLAEMSGTREVAEEAALKEAIVYFELGENEQCIELLLNFLRNHHASKLKQTAMALLIEILPKQLEKHLAEGNYVDAIVLAKKNRELFQNSWVDIELLSLLAKSYHELGIYHEAGKLYLYLLKIAGQVEKEKYYLPLLSILYAQGEHELVEDHVLQYNYNYPSGRDRQEISLIYLQSLVAAGKSERALTLLSSPLPDEPEVQEIAARVYFTTNRYARAIEVLTPAWKSGELRSDDSLFILAESFFQENFHQSSEELFLRLKEKTKFFDQSRHRLAMIAREREETEKSLKLFREIVEKGNDPLWKRLAEKELEFHEIDKQY